MREPIADDVAYEVFDRHMGKCLYCNTQTEFEDGRPHMVIPQMLGGVAIATNLVWCCNECKPHIKGRNRIQQGLQYLGSLE